jgi:hypothetical protein
MEDPLKKRGPIQRAMTSRTPTPHVFKVKTCDNQAPAQALQKLVGKRVK